MTSAVLNHTGVLPERASNHCLPANSVRQTTEATIFWPGTKTARSTGNAFTAAERGDTLIDWANTPGFQVTPKQRQQQNEARKHGWGDGDMGPLSDKPRLNDIAPRAFGQSPKKKVATA